MGRAPVFSNHGCRPNMYETAAMEELAHDAGLVNAVVINTCAVTAEAVRKARQDIRKRRRDNPDAKLIVTGCAAQIDPDSFASMDEVDHVVGNGEKMPIDPLRFMKMHGPGCRSPRSRCQRHAFS